MRSVFYLGSALLFAVAPAWTQESPKPASISDVTVSTSGDPIGLEPYLATLKTEIKKAWIDEWHFDFGPPDPGTYVLTLHINRAGYLGLIDGSEFLPAFPMPHRAVLENTGNCVVANCDPARLHRIEQISAAFHATERVFTGLPPELPAEYPNSPILVRVMFTYGTEKPRLQ